ncbi:MAG: phnA protein [Verrucomicrobiae bacterium]|nr:phnA protein [Verrucomicrobiae bacterium]NNJ42699.1 phnA protein [Akkermansiaceae bacterium]
MTKGYEAHQQRRMELSTFGKDLARRSKSKCELSGASGVPLHIYEIPPAPTAPDPTRCIMLCEQVIDQLNKPNQLAPDQWHHLSELVWSDIPAIQIMAYRILTHIAKKHIWAQDILDEAYLDDEIMHQANKEPL